MEYWSTMASLLGLLALLQTIFPPKLRIAILSLSTTIFSYFSSYIYFDITEIDGVNTNELYNAVQLYLTSSLHSTTTNNNRLSLTRPLNSTAVTFSLSNNVSISDEFHGVSLQWDHIVTPRQLQSWRIFPEEKRGFALKFKKQHKSIILNSYLDHILEKANEIRRRNQDRYLFTNPRGGGGGGGSVDYSRGCNPWEAVPFKHPSTFETLAIDPIKKREIVEDLKDFVNGKSFYQKTGRAWKRGYLLYGPPGTGKSSLIAAMSNFLEFDIYDLELTEVQSNSELRKLLMKTTPKSIIVIEDIDCSMDLSNRKKASDEFEIGGNGNGNSITLSGLLNFTDGLWSCCGSERMFVFTTNHMEKLDPALVRSGRMDMHIFMGFCSFPALKILLRNYLDWDEEEEEDEDLGGRILRELEQRIEKAEMSPAEISEILIKNRREKGRAMRRVLEALNVRGNNDDKKKLAINGVLRKKDEDDENRAMEKNVLSD